MDWLEKINLAPWKYRNILKENCGPIERLSVKIPEHCQDGSATNCDANTTKYPEDWLDANSTKYYEAYAYLKPELRPKTPILHQIYGNPDGTGTAVQKNIACYKAISEALERWAFYSISCGEHAKTYGFDQDPTTTGMAAFPGLSKGRAQTIAADEAIERWALVSFWENKIPVLQLQENSSGIKLLTPWTQTNTVILWEKNLDPEFYFYGFATEKTLALAISKARVELFRNQRALSKFFRKHKNTILQRTDEKRLIYFAQKNGHKHFLERTQIAAHIKTIPILPQTLINTEVLGPWSQYTTVWRCLFKTQSEKYLLNETNYFLF